MYIQSRILFAQSYFGPNLNLCLGQQIKFVSIVTERDLPDLQQDGLVFKFYLFELFYILCKKQTFKEMKISFLRSSSNEQHTVSK